MVHDFATRNRAIKAVKPVKTAPRRKPMSVGVIAALVTVVSVGAMTFSHVVSAVSADIHESMAEAQARKEAERALKAQRQAEKQRIADEKRVQAQVEEDKAQAEKNASYNFYEDLVGRPWPVPVASDAYTNQTLTATAHDKEDTSQIPYSLQAALFHDEKEASDAQRLLGKLGYTGKVDTITVKAGGTLYRLKLGPFTGLEKATQVRDKLQEHNYFAQVFRE